MLRRRGNLQSGGADPRIICGEGWLFISLSSLHLLRADGPIGLNELAARHENARIEEFIRFNFKRCKLLAVLSRYPEQSK